MKTIAIKRGQQSDDDPSMQVSFKMLQHFHITNFVFELGMGRFLLLVPNCTGLGKIHRRDNSSSIPFVNFSCLPNILWLGDEMLKWKINHVVKRKTKQFENNIIKLLSMLNNALLIIPYC